MKDSGVEWVGKIPEGWEVVPAYVHLKETKRKNIGLQEENVLSLSYGNIISKNVTENMGLIPASYETYQIVEPGQIVFRLTDLQNDKRSLRNGLVRERGIITSAYTAVRTQEGCLPSYFNYLFRAYDTTKVLYTLGSGVRQSSDYSELKRLPVVVPPTETQKEIVDYLDRKTEEVDGLIEKKKRMIELLKEKRTSIITHAVTKGLDLHAKMKDSGVEWIGEIPEGWEMKKLKLLCRVNPTKSSVGLDKTEIVSFLPMEKVGETGSLDLTEVKPLSEIYGGYTYMADGDVILAKITPCFENGKGAYLQKLTNGIAFGSTEFHVMRPEKIQGKFLYWLTQTHTFRKMGELTMTGTAGQQRVSERYVKEYPVVYPSQEIQNNICDKLEGATDQLARTIESLISQITKLAEYRNSLIYHAVTGKIRV